MKTAIVILTCLMPPVVVYEAVGQKKIESESDSCTTCIQQYVDFYLDEYFDVLANLTGAALDTFCADCLENWMVDSARTRAGRLSDSLPCINTDQVTGFLNLSSIVIQRQFQEVDSSFTQHDLDFAISISNWLGFNPNASPPTVNRPGCIGPDNCSAFFTFGVDTLPFFYSTNYGYGVKPLNYLWSWGDGTYDSIPYPSHVYTAEGPYTICLTVEDAAGCVTTYCDSDNLEPFYDLVPLHFEVIPDGGVSFDRSLERDEEFFIFPNPINNGGTLLYNLRQEEVISIWLYDLNGRILKQLITSEKQAGGFHEEPLILGNDLVPGVYFLSITSAKRSAAIKLIKQ